MPEIPIEIVNKILMYRGNHPITELIKIYTTDYQEFINTPNSRYYYFRSNFYHCLFKHWVKNKTIGQMPSHSGVCIGDKVKDFYKIFGCFN